MGIIEKYHSDGIHSIIDEYRNILDQAPLVLKMEGKSMREILQEQAYEQSYFDRKKSDLKILIGYYKNEVVDKVRSEIWKKLTENSNLDLSTRDKEMYILGDKRYYQRNTILLMIEEMYKQFEAVSDAFRARGFAVKNLTDLILVSLDEKVL